MLTHGPGRFSCGLSLVVLLAAWGCAREESPRAGAVVESCRAGDAADVAGLRVGDMVVEWRQGRVSGEVESPYHLAMVEQELAPYGPVELLLGSGESVVVATGAWGADYRPLLAGPDLPAHLGAARLADDGDHDGAARRWRRLADGLVHRGRFLDAAWTSARSAVAVAMGGDADECLAVLRSGAASVADRRLRAVHWERAGEALRVQGRTAPAAEAFSSAVEILEADAPTSPGLAFALLQLCRTDLHNCEMRSHRALELYRKVAGDSVEVATALNTAAAVAHLQSDLNTAEERYLEALEVVSGVAPGSPTECSLLGNLGLVARKRGDFAAARSFFTRERELAGTFGAESPQLAHAANHLGLLASQLGRYDEARGWYEEARAGFHSSADVAGILTNLGNVSMLQNDLPAARRYHEEALELRLRADSNSTRVPGLNI